MAGTTDKTNSAVKTVKKGAADPVEKRSRRPVRTPIHRARDILSVNDLPDDKVGRWVLNKPGRLQKFLDAGYEFVTRKGGLVGEMKIDGDQDLSDMVTVVGTNEGMEMYLMCIDRDWYNQDQAQKQEAIDAIDEELYAQVNKEGHYGSLKKNR